MGTKKQRAPDIARPLVDDDKVRTGLAAADEMIARSPLFADLVKELGGDAETAKEITRFWIVSINSVTQTHFDATKSRRRTSGQRATLGSAKKSAEQLRAQLDSRLAWLVACHAPDFDRSPDIVVALTERRMQQLRAELDALIEIVDLALTATPARKGREVELSAKLFHTTGLVKALLTKWAVAASTTERAKLVLIVNKCWEMAGYSGDSRDMLRSMVTIGNSGNKRS